jgi:hypothetical protein
MPFDSESAMTGALGGAQGMGYFDPAGSPYLRAVLQRRARRSADAMRRRGSVMSRLLGLDPYQQRQSMLDTERMASGTTANALNSAQENELMGTQDWMRGLLGTERGYQEQRRARGGWQSMLGQLLGMGAGAFTGGMGTGLAQKLTGGKKKPSPYEYES